MKKITTLFLLLILVFNLSACTAYTAVGLYQVETNNQSSLRFQSLSGTMDFDFVKQADGEGPIYFSASLEEGEMSVYYTTSSSDAKTLLCHLQGGETAADAVGSVAPLDKVKFIIEAPDGAKHGSIAISFVPVSNA